MRSVSSFCLKSLRAQFAFRFLLIYYFSLIIRLECKVLPYTTLTALSGGLTLTLPYTTLTALSGGGVVPQLHHWSQTQCSLLVCIVLLILLGFNSRLEHLEEDMLPPSGPEELHPWYLRYWTKTSTDEKRIPDPSPFLPFCQRFLKRLSSSTFLIYCLRKTELCPLTWWTRPQVTYSHSLVLLVLTGH